MKYKLSEIFEKPISGEWGNELEEGKYGAKVIRTTNFTNMGRLNLNDIVERDIDVEKYENKLLKLGDIIIEKSGGSPNQPVGRVVIFEENTSEKYFCNNFTSILRPKNIINAKYSLYLLKDLYNKKRVLKYQNKTTGIINLKLNDYLNNTEIMIPSIEEQIKISTILDRSQELIDKRKEQIEDLDELVKSQFIEMFGDPISNPKGWYREKMNDVAPVVNYKGDFNEEKIWLLNLDMVESNTGKIIDYNYVMKNEIGSSTCTFDTTNVLYSKLRPYLNKVVIPNSIGYATSEMVPLQPLNSKINRYYLTYMLRNKSFVDYISEKVAGAKMPRVSMNDFRNFEVPIPPIELQNQFVDFVKQVDKLKFEMEKSLKELEDNFSSLMQKAFSGELFN